MKDFYFTLIKLLKQGKNPSSISKQLNVSKQKINYYIRKLKNEGKLIKKGYGVWEVREVKSLTFEHTNQKPKEIRGHAFIWSVQIPKKVNWKERLGKESYKLIRGYIPRIIINNCKIWLGKKSITVYEPHSFYGRNAIESNKYAVISLLEILGLLESKLGVKLRPYQFKPAREHYGIIKNDLAIQCNRQGEKIHVYDDLEGEWLWVDDSLSLGELETGGSKALNRNLQVQNWWNDHKKNNFEVTSTFILEAVKGVTQNQLMDAQNIIKHQKVLDGMLKVQEETLVTLKKIQLSLDNNGKQV